MPVDRPDTAVLCGAFAHIESLPARLTAAGYDVLADIAGDGAALTPTDDIRFVICDADDLPAERCVAVAQSPGARTIIVGRSADAERILGYFRAGACDYISLTGSGDGDRILESVDALRAGGGLAPAAQLVGAVQRLVGRLQHDLKNPIGNILGYIDILRDETDVPPTEEQIDLLRRVEQNCENALALIARFADTASRLR